ncbi:MAG: hypothetical protein SF052_09730 [Bacteroidia bacterium]|nr:hypothetical protein [Bacteroidia bacterium]
MNAEREALLGKIGRGVYSNKPIGLNGKFPEMKYTKSRINKWTIYFILFLLFASSLGYLFMPAQMLSIVGIEGTKESNFLVKTVAAALLSLIPSAFAITRTNGSINVKWYVVLGLATNEKKDV